MRSWTAVDLHRIATTDEVHLATMLRDGALRNPVTIWAVVVGNNVSVRAAYGRQSSWFKGRQSRREGQFQAGSLMQDVTFADAPDALKDAIDEDDRRKYRAYPGSLAPMVAQPARDAGLHPIPKSDFSAGSDTQVHLIG